MVFARRGAGPVEELIELEDDADLELLVSEVSSSLPERRRDVLALYGAGCKRSQIADRLGLPERVVKRDLEAIMDEARATLARLAGGGCERGEPLVMRLLCGISDPEESAQAREHLSHCGRCELFSERLIAWREKAGAMLPAPVAEGASPGVLGRIAESSTERLASLQAADPRRRRPAQTARDDDLLPRRRSDAAGRRSARHRRRRDRELHRDRRRRGDYCVEQGVDPLGAAKGLIASAPERARACDAAGRTGIDGADLHAGRTRRKSKNPRRRRPRNPRRSQSRKRSRSPSHRRPRTALSPSRRPMRRAKADRKKPMKRRSGASRKHAVGTGTRPARPAVWRPMMQAVLHADLRPVRVSALVAIVAAILLPSGSRRPARRALANTRSPPARPMKPAMSARPSKTSPPEG